MALRSDGVLPGVGRLHLAYRTWEASPARAALIVVHGLGEHSGRYDEFAMRMAASGISTFAMDLRGHGLSEGKRGHTPSFDVYLQELDRFRREVDGLIEGLIASSGEPAGQQETDRSLAARPPLFLLGHSLGGLIALRYIEEYSGHFDGAVIVSPWLATAMPIPRLKATVANLVSKVLPALPFRSGLDAHDLSRDPAVVEAYRSDPLVHGRITPRLFTEASHAMGVAFQRSDRIREPLLFLLAGDDRIVDTSKSSAFARGITAVDEHVRVFPDHFHELLNEPDRAEVHRLVREWILERIG